MKINVKVSYVERYEVSSVPCCRGLFELIDSHGVIVTDKGMFVQSMMRDTKLYYCPQCGTKVEIIKERGECG